MACSCERCATKPRPAAADARAVADHRAAPGTPSAVRRHRPYSPRAHAGHGSRPRCSQASIGLTITRSPGAHSPAAPRLPRRAHVLVAERERERAERLEREAVVRRDADRSLPQMPAQRGLARAPSPGPAARAARRRRARRSRAAEREPGRRRARSGSAGSGRAGSGSGLRASGGRPACRPRRRAGAAECIACEARAAVTGSPRTWAGRWRRPCAGSDARAGRPAFRRRAPLPPYRRWQAMMDRPRTRTRTTRGSALDRRGFLRAAAGGGGHRGASLLPAGCARRLPAGRHDGSRCRRCRRRSTPSRARPPRRC
jgi:hypothetical protein